MEFGDTYFLSRHRARLRRAFPRAYEALERASLRLGALRLFQSLRRLRAKEETKSSAVLHSDEELRAYLQGAKEARAGKSAAKSVVVSGVFEDVGRCLNEVGLCPHTVQFSLGVFGRTDLLPTDKVLELTTMCGHHMIPPSLVHDLAAEVARGKATPEGAARTMGGLCSCAIFNERRAAQVISDLAR
jgi:hypothetical protein